MTSEKPGEAYVWIWLAGAAEPVVAGRLEAVGDIINLIYGQSYLRREDATASIFGSACPPEHHSQIIWPSVAITL